MNHRSALTVLIVASGLVGMSGARAGTPAPPLHQRVRTGLHGAGGNVSAAPVAQQGARPAAPAQRPTEARPERRVALLSAAVITDQQLATARGGTDVHVNQNTATGTVAGNVASQLTTGSNAISNSAFSNSAGIPIVIQNTGNNVLIQNSTILNLQLTNPQ